MSAGAEAFLDQVITWRELGFNCCHMRKDYDQYESLPAWAQKTLKEHENDARTARYSLEELEGARTHDPLWNAAQTQLVTEGRIHNYLRMLWGKKIIEWTRSPREALRVMIELNNRYALDGRDPNSYSGIFWCLGRYDRPWGPERPIFGNGALYELGECGAEAALENVSAQILAGTVELLAREMRRQRAVKRNAERCLMKTFHFDDRLWLPRSRPEVFEFFSDAFNLEKITPPWLKFHVVTAPPIRMQEGTEIEYRLKITGNSDALAKPDYRVGSAAAICR